MTRGFGKKKWPGTNRRGLFCRVMERNAATTASGAKAFKENDKDDEAENEADGRKPAETGATDDKIKCPKCGKLVDKKRVAKRRYVCPECNG